MKKRIMFIRVAEILLIVFISLLTVYANTRLVTSWYSEDMDTALADLDVKIQESLNQDSWIVTQYIEMQKHNAGLAAYYLNNAEDPAYSKETLDELNRVLLTEQVAVTDSSGNVLSSSGGDFDLNISEEAYQTLLSVSAENAISKPVPFLETLVTKSLPKETDASAQSEAGEAEKDPNVILAELAAPEDETSEHEEAPQPEADDTNLEYLVSAYLAPDRIVVIHTNDVSLFSSFNSSVGIQEILERGVFGQSGFCFVTADTPAVPGRITYYPENKGQQPETLGDLGLPLSLLEDGCEGFYSISGSPHFIKTKTREDYVVSSTLFCAVPFGVIFRAVFFISTVTLAVFITVILLLRKYARYLLLSLGTKGDVKEKRKRFRDKLLVLVLLGVFATVLCSMYMETLYFYANAINQNKQDSLKVRDMAATLDSRQQQGSEVYRNYITVMTLTASSLIQRNPDYLNSRKLEELAGVLGAGHILVYDLSGKVIASDLNYTGLTLSGNQSGSDTDFRWVLRGKPILIQEEVNASYLDEPFRFSGAPIRDDDGNYEGLVLLAIAPSVKTKLSASSSLETVLSSFSSGNDSFSFAVDMNSKTIYAPDKELDQVNAEELGLTTNELRTDYAGFLRLGSRTLIGCCSSGNGLWLFTVSDPSGFVLSGIKYGFLSSLPGVLGELIFFLALLVFYYSSDSFSEDEVKEYFRSRKHNATEAAEQFHHQTRTALFIISGFISFLLIFGKNLFNADSLEYYVFVHQWPNGINIFIITRCLLVICLVSFLMTIFLKLLSLMSSLLSPKYETVTRMLLSFVKYVSVLGMIFYCLTLLGVPTPSLLASAGVLSILFSMGAQSLVADILAGLFIIFEGTFKVGDMITVNDWHGQVMEIGIRNTTIRDLLSSDVKIMNNSTIRNVINFSVYPSYCAIGIGIEYGMDLREIDEIVEREKPVLKEKLPLMIGEIRYLGVDSFQDSAVILKFEASCRNQDYHKMKRALNREIKLMFDRNGINVPFPQVVLHGDEQEKPKTDE